MSPTPTTELGIRRAGLDEQVAVATTVAAAFFDDPVTTWLLPHEPTRRALVQPLFELYVAPYLRLGETYRTEDGAAAAVWAPPGSELFEPAEEEAFGAALGELVGPDAERFALLAEIFAQHHPAEPLYYCQFLATVPARQGHGLGSAFLRDMLERADREQVPAYHEATTPRNRALYERHGYETIEEFRLPDGPPLWAMWRAPSSPSSAQGIEGSR